MPDPYERDDYRMLLRPCADFILDALVGEMVNRSLADLTWIEKERLAVAVAANQWAEAHGIRRRVTVDDVERSKGWRSVTPTMGRSWRSTSPSSCCLRSGSVTDRGAYGSDPHTLHGCEVVMYGGDTPEPVPCETPATWWTAPTGRSFFVCANHQDEFANTSTERHDRAE